MQKLVLVAIIAVLAQAKLLVYNENYLGSYDPTNSTIAKILSFNIEKPANASEWYYGGAKAQYMNQIFHSWSTGHKDTPVTKIAIHDLTEKTTQVTDALAI
jgi:hypothetical protein